MKHHEIISRSQPDLSTTCKLLVALMAVLMSTMPTTAYAHEKWFVDDRPYPVRFDLMFTLPVVVSLVVAASALTILMLVRRIVRDPFFPNPQWLRPVNASVPAVLGIQTAISLVYMAVQGWLLAPTLKLPWDAIGVTLL